jgi:preprotein translocase subunit YajC
LGLETDNGDTKHTLIETTLVTESDFWKIWRNDMNFLSHWGIILAQATSPQGSGNLFASLLPLILIVVVMYLLLIRPQTKRQKEHRRLLASLKPGDEIVTAGGLHGSIAGIREKQHTLLVRIAENVKVEVDLVSVTRVKSLEERTKE